MKDAASDSSKRINTWDIDAEELARLRSSDSIISDDAWAKLWKRMLPLVEKKIEFRLRESPQRIRERIDDIAQDVAFEAAKKIHIRADKSFGQYLYGIVENTCVQALRPTFHSKLMGDSVRKYKYTLLKRQGMDNKTTPPELSEQLRKAVTRGLQNVLAELADQSSRPRVSDARAPVLGMLAIDLSCRGRPAPADLIGASGIKSHTATRLRDHVAGLMFQAMEPELRKIQSAPGTEAPSFDVFLPDLDAAFVWLSHHNMGCPPWWFQDVDPSHADDVALYLETHCALGSCPYCSANQPDEFGQDRLEHWLNATKDSMLKVRSNS